MTIYLDTETTGLSSASGDAIVEIAIVDAAGEILIDTLVDPGRQIPWGASSVHGITDEMVRGKPTLGMILPRIKQIICGQQVVIYNSSFDTQFFPDRLRTSQSIHCAMKRYATVTGGSWRKLDVAAKHVGHRWVGKAHRALADALACRSVWMWLERHSR